MQVKPKATLALDIGEKRIGVALASNMAGLACPLTTLNSSDNFFLDLQQIIEDENVGVIVVGLPRGMEGQETDQTRAVKTFVAQLKSRFNLPFYWQDEAVTSIKARAELDSRHKASVKGDVDALAATYILEDFLKERPEGLKHG
jgi:putative Holliday junction resolvase